MPVQIGKCNSFVIIDLCMLGINSECVIICTDGILKTPQFIECNAFEDPRLGVVPLDGE